MKRIYMVYKHVCVSENVHRALRAERKTTRMVVIVHNLQTRALEPFPPLPPSPLPSLPPPQQQQHFHSEHAPATRHDLTKSIFSVPSFWVIKCFCALMCVCVCAHVCGGTHIAGARALDTACVCVCECHRTPPNNRRTPIITIHYNELLLICARRRGDSGDGGRGGRAAAVAAAAAVATSESRRMHEHGL